MCLLQYILLVASALKCWDHTITKKAKTCEALPDGDTRGRLCEWQTAQGVTSHTGGCTHGGKGTHEFLAVAGECIRQMTAGVQSRAAEGILTVCYCDTDLCNKACTATDCKAATAGNGTDFAQREFQKCTANCKASNAKSEIPSSVMILATQAMTGFLVLNMKMIIM